MSAGWLTLTELCGGGSLPDPTGASDVWVTFQALADEGARTSRVPFVDVPGRYQLGATVRTRRAVGFQGASEALVHLVPAGPHQGPLVAFYEGGAMGWVGGFLLDGLGFAGVDGFLAGPGATYGGTLPIIARNLDAGLRLDACFDLDLGKLTLEDCGRGPVGALHLEQTAGSEHSCNMNRFHSISIQNGRTTQIVLGSGVYGNWFGFVHAEWYASHPEAGQHDFVECHGNANVFGVVHASECRDGFVNHNPEHNSVQWARIKAAGRHYVGKWWVGQYQDVG